MSTSVEKPAELKLPSPQRDPLASLRIERPESRPERPPRRGRWWIALLILLAAAGATFRYGATHGWSFPGWMNVAETSSSWVPDIIQNRPEARLVSVVVEKGQSADAVVVATGYIESRRQAKIGARAPGRIEVIHVEEGKRVKQHELLAVLEHADLDASLNAVSATVAGAKAAIAEQEILIEQAQVAWKRAEALWSQRSVAESERDEAKFTYQSAVARKNSLAAELALAEARRAEAEQVKENMFIRAPFDGTIISKDAEVGESILPGGMGEASGRGSVATIADLEHLEVECDVKEDYITRIADGQRAEIAIDAVPNRRYDGKVRKIIPMGDRARATIKVQVTIVDSDQYLFPEMSGTVYFLPLDGEASNSDEPRLFVPSDAIVTDATGSVIAFTVDSTGRARKLPLTVGEARDGRTEVLGGLEGNERLVRRPGTWDAGQLLKVVE